MPPNPRPPKLPRKEFDFLSVWDHVGVESSLDGRRSFHTCAAIALTEIHHSDMHADHKRSAFKAVLQMWDFVAAEYDENVEVDYGRAYTDTDVVER